MVNNGTKTQANMCGCHYPYLYNGLYTAIVCVWYVYTERIKAVEYTSTYIYIYIHINININTHAHMYWIHWRKCIPRVLSHLLSPHNFTNRKQSADPHQSLGGLSYGCTLQTGSAHATHTQPWHMCRIKYKDLQIQHYGILCKQHQVHILHKTDGVSRGIANNTICAKI